MDINRLDSGVDHGAPDTAGPVKVGFKTTAWSATPTLLDAGDRSDLMGSIDGLAFIIGGHPNIVTTEFETTAAQTDLGLVVVGAGSRIVVVQVDVTSSATAATNFRIGMGATTLPALALGGAAGIFASHPGLPSGGSYVKGNGAGILVVGSLGADVRLTCAAPTGGALRVVLTHFTSA